MMKFARVLTADMPFDSGVASWIKWKTVDAVIAAADGSVIFEQRGVEVPEQWSQNAANIMAQKYFRKAGVPDRTKPYSLTSRDWDSSMPLWMQPAVPGDAGMGNWEVTYGGETSARQVFHRMAGCWAYWGWREGLLTTEADARVFYDEVYASLALQYAAPNSPQWFNTGLHWAYGIEGPDSGQWVAEKYHRNLQVTGDDINVYRVSNSYERPQPHACFIQTVQDDLVNPGGMMDLWTREARLFKHGSGTGSNFSKVRGKGERLSGGGVSSGLMSFLRVGDRSAGSIKSGGTTRRAAKMVVLDADHPEIEDFVDWKVTEEYKAACIAVGSQVIHDQLREVSWSQTRRVPRGLEDHAAEALRSGVPQSLVDRARAGDDEWPVYEADSFEGAAIETVSGQNSNNSVRVTGEFLDHLKTGEPWLLTNRTDGEVAKEVSAKDLWRNLCRAAWASGDPGVQFDDAINEWHTCSADGRINASNPCSEYLFLDDTACNLASLRLTKFLPLDDASLVKFEYVARLWTVVLEISVHMASFPSEAIARNTYLYRTLGLGYADLGGLLMRLAIPYASDEGRALAAGLTALMTGVAYRTSAEMAEEVGPFPRWEPNAEGMRRVLCKHQDSIRTDCSQSIYDRCRTVWNDVQNAQSFRNAQVTVLAPTGTIGFVMDCDTTGIEPDFALVKEKKLAGGGSMRIVNQAVLEALRRLGINQYNIDRGLRQIEEVGHLDKDEPYADVFACAGDISPEDHVKMVAAVQPFLSGGVSKTVNLPRDATVDDVDRVYRLAARLGLKSVSIYRDGSKLSQPLSAGKKEAYVLNVVGMTDPGLRMASPVDGVDASEIFDSENQAGARPDSPDVVRTPGPSPERVAPSDGVSGPHDFSSLDENQKWLANKIAAISLDALRDRGPILSRGQREYLPWRRERCWSQKIKIGQDRQSVYLRASEYPDGRLGEIFLDIAGEGSMLRTLANCLAMAVSVGLQHGVPVTEYVDQFVSLKFEPAGYVEGHARIRFASSIADYIGRELGIAYAGRDDLANAPTPIAEAVERIAEASAQRDQEWQAEEEKRLVAHVPYAPRLPDGGPGPHASWKPTGDSCPMCGSLLRRSGTCRSCPNCAYDEGCG
jgi:ribonucleoside-diphosphate reductase alpha chain